MSRKTALLLTFLMVAQVSFGQKVGYKAKDVDYELYQSFNFMEITFADSILTPDRQRSVGILRSGISQELEKRGIKFSAEPAIEINVLISIADHQITRETDY